MKGSAVDCIGLVIGVARELGLVALDFDKNGYNRIPDGVTLKAGCDAHMDRVALQDLACGHVLLMCFESQPQHMAIVGKIYDGSLTMIHAYSHARPPRVVEHRLAPVWRARIVQAYAISGVEYGS
jgi:cell wall-associated NlpC family hydrolase